MLQIYCSQKENIFIIFNFKIVYKRYFKNKIYVLEEFFISIMIKTKLTAYK